VLTETTRAGQPRPDPLALLGNLVRRPFVRGRPDDSVLDRAVGAALGVGALDAAAGHPFVALLFAGAVVAQGRRSRAMQARKRERTVAAALPDLVDLLCTAVGAGCTADGALRAVAPHSPDSLRSVLEEAVRRLDLGASFEDALAPLGELAGGVAQPVARLLIAAQLDGVPLAPALERLGSAARRQTRLQAEESARRLPVRLLLPVVLCTLPAFALLTVVPALLATLGRLR
jgi:tight adherence protein C